jgi:N-acetyl sugar amidotransferase
VLPATRPGIELRRDGVCNACHHHAGRRDVDWATRARRFAELVADAKARATGYDCVVPVSGGKDSTWQVVTCLERGLVPLAVTWKTPARTEEGRRNLENLVNLGVDHVDYQVSPAVERKLLLRSFERYGSTAIPMHMALFAIPLSIAVRFGIPLVVWGENSAAEYGGADGEVRAIELDSRWLEKHGVTHGTKAEDWIGDDLTRKELAAYFAPGDRELAAAGVRAVFLGQFFPWDPRTALDVARAHGFRSRAAGPKTGIYDFADIDDDFISIHHWLKWYKFGFTRSFDNLSLEIRNGRLTRDEAIGVLRERGDETPLEDIERFCEFVRIARDRFFEIAERFRSPEVWTRHDGRWVIERFLVQDWRW